MDHQLLIKDLKRPVVILDVDKGHFVDCNDRALDFFELSKKEILKKKPYELSPSHVYGHEAEAYSRQLIQEALAGANPVFDWIHVDKYGNEIPCEIRLIRFPPFKKQLVRGTIIDKRNDNGREIRESEERLRLTLQSANIGTFDWYPKAGKVSWDDGLFEIFGLKPNERADLNEYFFSVIHPDDQVRVKKEFDESLDPDGPDIHHIEYRVVINDRVKHLLANSKMIRDDKGEVTRMLGTTQDITQLRESEKKLEESERSYRNIFNQQFQFSALLDMDGKIVHINDLALKTQRVLEDAFIGQYFWNAPGWKENKKIQQRVKTQIEQLKREKEPLLVEDEFVDAMGKTHYSRSHYSLIKNGRGDFENILVQAIDVTEEKNSKKEIAEREEKLNTIFNVTSDNLLLINVEKNYTIEEVNNTFLKLSDFFGVELNRKIIIGKDIEWLYREVKGLDDNGIKRRFDRFEKVCQSKKRLRFNQRIEKEGRLMITETVLSPVVQNKMVTHILMRMADITQKELSKIELQEAYQELSKLKVEIEQENVYLKEEIRLANDYENMVFTSMEFRSVLNKVEQVAKTDATVLITGETGTGKELIARAIHDNSRRADKPMIKLNTAAIPKDLIESELFGHEKGAFTGAVGEKPGKFELADGGTIFLDEIGDMPLDLQVKILRVLQEGEVERLGGTTAIKVNVRIISATNRNLKKAIEEGGFREDLFFRLNVFPIEIPPLRSRSDDIPILVEHFIAKYSIKHSNRVTKISKKTMDYLKNYPWPGNVRELENTIERSVILSHESQLILPEVSGSSVSEPWIHDNALDTIQENHIRKVLSECHWKIEGKDGAASQLKIKPSTLRDKMNKFGIKRPE